MISPIDKLMLKDFGFRDYDSLKKSLKTAPGRRFGKYDFKWRLKMMSKYNNHKSSKSSVKDEIIKYHIGYEDYVLKSRSGRNAIWPKKTLKLYAFLFEELENPWQIDNTHKRKRLYSISDPNKKIWFRAISYHEMIEAIDICYKNSYKFGTKTKTKNYPCRLKWNECVASYSKARNMHSKYYPGMTPKDYDVALLICDNITSTWNNKTGNWKPWNLKYRWLQLAYWDESYISMANLREKNVKFSHVAAFVNTKAMKGNAMAFYILGVAYAVGGTRAAKIIKRFSSKKGINLFRKTIQDSKNIPNASRTHKTVDATIRYNELMNPLNPFK
ncbi:MAG TPA: hypothetical protein ENN90_03745 [Mariniphaga anaerophila]|uniref:Uncharacterized protein n=1 Tax=Mariniphaga anaerophila TaxID=1484053 RepID=A0A831PQ70_9BACT|nr:hypothetical protein [Mariniphaga anaerophila]